ncbi:hypothetical protein [Devosia sp. MC521]|uniref:hypothetical protein n=1 Tax=Devosia sp. MC521 TaxID=2759954 RepID=UPI0015FD1CFA|nr:hypothetical protein [Devosia sp. MC521]MBJ6988962.1 hypothetical protein [Devosia sp. MC521]QMW64394.1 hypothetical protein H4N61_08895 [Devosia sp. MC521]
MAETAGLTGEIDSGEPKNSADMALCLDSPGGNYMTGRDMAQFVHQHGIATRILAGSECFSSCAFLFMAGHSLGAEVDGPRRILTIGGALGFHAPYLDLKPTETFDGAETSELATLTLQLIADFIDFSSYSSVFDHRPMFSMSLLEDTLRMGPSEMSVVDTVQEVARWSIELDGQRENAVLSDQQLVQACMNFQAWSFDRPSERVTDFSWYLPLQKSTQVVYGDETEFGLVDTGGMEVRNCSVEVNTAPQTGFLICSRDDFTGVQLGQCDGGYGFWQPWYYALPPATPLIDLR